MVVPVMVACVITLAAGYGLGRVPLRAERVAHALTPQLLTRCWCFRSSIWSRPAAVTMIVAARVKSSRAAQQIAGPSSRSPRRSIAGLGFVASQLGEGWPLLALGVGLVVADVLASRSRAAYGSGKK